MFRHNYSAAADIADLITEAQFRLASEILASAMRIISEFPRSRFLYRAEGDQYPRVCIKYVCIWIAPIAPSETLGEINYIVELEGRSGEHPFVTDRIVRAIDRAGRAEEALHRGALRRRGLGVDDGSPLRRHPIHLKKLQSKLKGDPNRGYAKAKPLVDPANWDPFLRG